MNTRNASNDFPQILQLLVKVKNKRRGLQVLKTMFKRGRLHSKEPRNNEVGVGGGEVIRGGAS